jgi:uncharacterized coiled-coil protein SlyX
MLLLRHESSTRKWIAAFILVALVCLYCLVSDVFAGNKKSKPSETGAANGVAHRVAALEAAQAETEDAIALLVETVGALQTEVSALQSQVTLLEGRVADLEAAGATTTP